MDRITAIVDGMVVGVREIMTAKGPVYVVDVYSDGTLVNILRREDGLVQGELYRARVRISADKRFGLRVYEVERL